MRADESMVPSGTVTFLFTDIEGSTRLWDEHPDQMRTALARHDELLRAAIDARGGHVFATGGDGYAVAFTRATDALEAGVAAQRAMAAESWPDDCRLRVRMGAHTGEVDERDGDYFGPAVNRSARIMGAAHGGQLVVSAVTAALLESAPGTTLIDLGSVVLKGLNEPAHVFGVAVDGLEWVEKPLIAVQPTAGNLPRLQTEFVGSLANLQERAAALPQTALATLTGAGGVGKTRAAVEVGWLVVDDFADGVWFAELGAVADRESVISVVASMLGVQTQADIPLVDSIVDWCLGRRMLLVLDNCEHVLDPVVELVTAVLDACPTVSVLATSREPLGVSGEQVIRVPSLDSDRSMELFFDRAAAVDSPLDRAVDAEAVAAICERLDGIPLAIELAAARTRSLSPSELLERLHDRFRLLRGGGRGTLERQQTLRATVTWSYQLLGPQEQLLFDRLSVFAGPFDLRAAERVCADDELDELDVIDVIDGLVDKSMLVIDRGPNGSRYRQLETLRQYAEERLDDRGETALRRDAHLRHYLDVVVELEDGWFSAAQVEANALLASEWNNLRAAHMWAITSTDLAAAEALMVGVAGYAVEHLVLDHRFWVERTIDMSVDLGEPSAIAISGGAVWAVVEGDGARAVELTGRVADLGAEGEAATIVLAGHLIMLGVADRLDEAGPVESELRRRLDDPLSPRAEHYARQALAMMSSTRFEDSLAFVDFGRRTGNPAASMRAALSAGLAKLREAPPAIDEALAFFDEASGYEPTPGTTWAGHLVACARASADVLADSPAAAESIHDALVLTYGMRNWTPVGTALDLCAGHLVGRDPEGAATILGWVAQGPPPAVGAYAAIRARARAEIAADPQAAGWMAAGAARDRHDIVEFALDRLSLEIA